jgi:formamidopyrimidine-DNA glycosylase
VPELPEVETVRLGLAPHLVGRRLVGAALRERRLRWPVDADLGRRVAGQQVQRLWRRAKYLLLDLEAGHLILHLGMSGSLRLVEAGTAPGPHEHLDLELDDGRCLRLHDPRRFGAVLYTPAEPLSHPLLARLGPEPLEAGFDGDWLYRLSRGRLAPVKAFLMDGRVVVGVGNIYASESLFAAGIRPTRPAGRVGLARYRVLAEAVRYVLKEAIRQGGTTLRDFVDSRGEPGYFAVRLQVYGRAGEVCANCGAHIRRQNIAQRSSYYCPGCQR